MKKEKKFFIPHSGININRKINKNISFFDKIEKKTIDNKRKSNLFQLKKHPFQSTNTNLITNISHLYINNETKENKENKKNIIERNRSPFLLRRIINFTLGDSSIKEDTKKDSNKSNESNNKKINNKKEEETKGKNMFYSRFKSSIINREKKEKFKRDNLIHSINLLNLNFSSKIRKRISSARHKNQSENKKNKSKEIDRTRILSKRESNLKKLIDCKNLKSKSENRLKEKGKEKVILNYNSKKNYKSKKKEKNEISLKPKDIIEPSKIDPSKDIPIINEIIKKNKKLYQDIQRRLKRVLLKGKLPQFFLENYTIIIQLGEGSFGSIYEVFNKDTKMKYAKKKIISNDIHSLEVFQRELKL